MSTFHHVYGNLLTAKEVSSITGFTLNQLRNWRLESRSHLAPFGSILIGSTSYYREVVVQDWLDENGQQNGVYRMTERDKKFPLNIAVEGDIKRRTAIDTLGGITTENILAWRTKLSAQDRENLNAFMKEYGYPIWRKMRGLAPDAEVLTLGITEQTRFTNVEWFAGWVKAIRMYLNNRNGFGFTEEEVDELPIGALPPTNETKKI